MAKMGMGMRRMRARSSTVVALVFAALLFLFLRNRLKPAAWDEVEQGALTSTDHTTTKSDGGSKSDRSDVELVVASMSHENTSWMHTYFPEWKKNIYVVDDPDAELTVPMNKGREAMVYLTYIIDHYASLPSNILFIHAERFQWHNDDPDYDGLPLLRKLRIPYLQREGYVNLRCVWVIGCPSEIKPFAGIRHRKVTKAELAKELGEDIEALGLGDADAETEIYLEEAAGDSGGPGQATGKMAADKVDGGDNSWLANEAEDSEPPSDHRDTKNSYAAAFELLMPELLPVPDVVGVSCCAQFAVTREAVRRRPKADYVRYRDWLLHTELKDEISGRVLEYTWHMIFGKEPVFCPSAEDCYCKLFGMCDLECLDAGSCEGQYTLPKYATLPQGWPRVGWDKEDRPFDGPL